MNPYLHTKNNSIDSKSNFAILNCSNIISNYLENICNEKYTDIIILCIGTDRATGDSLGPLVGYKLEPVLYNYNNISVLGTLDEPVHAKNLENKIDYISTNYENPFTIAIDASLGNFNKIGYINIKQHPLKPGLGVNKKLPMVGNMSITGVVNINGIMEHIILQNTRLSIVMKMADIISKSIYMSIRKYIKQIKSEF